MADFDSVSTPLHRLRETGGTLETGGTYMDVPLNASQV